MTGKILLVFLVCMLMPKASNVFGQKMKVVSEEEYKGKCLHNFSWYVQWPDEYSKNDFVIGIVGDKKLFEFMVDNVKGKKTALQEVQVKYFSKASEVEGFNHILFISSWQSHELNKTLETQSLNHTLIVTEKEGMVSDGAAINFIIHNGYLHFEMCRENITKMGLKVSSRLEQLAIRTI